MEILLYHHNYASGTKSGSASRPSAVGQGSQRAVAVAALLQLLTAEKKRSPKSSPVQSAEAIPLVENALSEVEDFKEDSENGSETNLSTFSYEQLRAHSENPVTGIDFKQREAYLSDGEFQAVLGMPKEEFYKLPRWKQDRHKKTFDLF
ncbi:unnamed protein product [Camellia sinensis]